MTATVIDGTARFDAARRRAEGKLDTMLRLGMLPEASLTAPVISYPAPGTVRVSIQTTNWDTLHNPTDGSDGGE